MQKIAQRTARRREGAAVSADDFQHDLLGQLAAVDEKLRALRDQRYLLELEKKRLEYKLRICGHRPPTKASK
jgi:hypothetical protein